MTVKRTTKNGHDKRSAAHREALFVEAYLANGHNATQAAIAAGIKGSRVDDYGCKMSHRPSVRAAIAARAQAVADAAEMSTSSWARELRAIAFSRPGDLFGPDGKLLPIHTLPPHVQAGLASVKVSVDGTTIECRWWDKNAALTTMARHLGLFERDNKQIAENLRVRVELVG